MSTPLGHSLAGIALARRLGVRSRGGLAAATVAASLPDADVIAGLVLHRDAWRLHRQGTHTAGFALTAGILAGFAGLITAGSAEGERDLIADALTGAVLVGSHIVLDRLPLPYAPLRRGMTRRRAVRNACLNWTLDAAVFGTLAWLARPPEAAAPNS